MPSIVSVEFDRPRRVELSRHGWGTQGNFIMPVCPGERSFHYVSNRYKASATNIGFTLERGRRK